MPVHGGGVYFRGGVWHSSMKGTQLQGCALWGSTLPWDSALMGIWQTPSKCSPGILSLLLPLPPVYVQLPSHSIWFTLARSPLAP